MLLSPQDEAVLLRCRTTLASDTNFAEQEGMLREPTETLLSTVTSGLTPFSSCVVQPLMVEQELLGGPIFQVPAYDVGF